AGGAGREVPDGLALPQSPGAPDDDEKGERVAALHAMFSGFCHPSPSYGGVAGAYELERARVRSLTDEEGKEGGIGGDSTRRATLPTGAGARASTGEN
ncbi:hypothetical protein THAOC_29662, partial [Thalassiosira oceanica]